MRRFLSLLPALLATVAAPASAATWQVPSGVASVAAALDSAAAGDTVLVAAGAYFEHGLFLESGVTLRGATGQAADVTLDAAGQGRVLEAVGISGARLEGITIANGKAPVGNISVDSGGGLRLSDSSIDITNCAFVGNEARYGGGLACFDSSPSLSGCEFTANGATSDIWAIGGGIYCQYSEPILSDCTFTANWAASVQLPGDGGAIFSKGCQLVAQDCVFGQNTAQAGAGAFYSWEFDRSRLVRCTFQENVANAGGAMYLERSPATIEDCDFLDNDALNGGALFLDPTSTPTVLGSRFTGNEATANSGGAVDVWGSSVTLWGCTFTNNSSVLRGGALSLNGGSDALVAECLFVGNTAQGAGGAIRLAWTAVANIESCTLVGNGTPGSGGGIHAEASSTVFVDRSVIAFGTAGEAVSCAGSATATLACSDLFGNAGGDWIGCIAGQAGTGGNLSVDPGFCNAAAGDFSLILPDSPCLPPNNSCAKLIGAFDAGCGCPSGATILVPADEPTIAAALVAASPGDVVGVCDGTWTEAITLRSGVHLVGASSLLSRVEWPGAGAPTALLVARGIADTTVVADLTLDALGAVPAVVLAESLSTGLHLQRNVITGGQTDGVVNDADSFVRIGGALEYANDIFGNGGASPRNVRNLNVGADSLDALLNFWGTTRYDSILATIEGEVRSCPITDSTHTKILCAPLSALAAPFVAAEGLALGLGPNPFRGACRIVFSAPVSAVTGRLEVFDVRGRRVRLLHHGPLPAGASTVIWGGRDDQGRSVAPGIYFLRLETPQDVVSRKLVRLR